MQNQNIYFRPFVSKYFDFDGKTGFLLLILFTVSRFALVLHASMTGNYQFVSIIFVMMILSPFVLLTKEGKKKIGMKLPSNWFMLISGGFFAALSCAMMYYLALFFFGLGRENWFVYISHTYSNVPAVLSESSKLTFFLIYSGISMFFSPFGEELFYRGIVHECFAQSFGDRIGSVIDSAAFSLVHLAHFGIVFSMRGGWEFLPFASFLWVGSLFFTCFIFYRSRVASGSISGAVFSHAIFNLVMNYFIFYHIF